MRRGTLWLSRGEERSPRAVVLQWQQGGRSLRPVFATLFAAGATLFYTCGTTAPAVGGETSRAGWPAPSAQRGIKITTSESALDLNRTEALLSIYLCPIADYLVEITRMPMTPRNRFLIVWAKDREQYYVQCMFFDANPLRKRVRLLFRRDQGLRILR